MPIIGLTAGQLASFSVGHFDRGEYSSVLLQFALWMLLLSSIAIPELVKCLPLCPINSIGNTNPLHLRTKFIFVNSFTIYLLPLTHSIAQYIENLFEVLTISLSVLSLISISLMPNF